MPYTMVSSSTKMTLHILIDNEDSGYCIIQSVRMLTDWLQILARFS